MARPSRTGKLSALLATGGLALAGLSGLGELRGQDPNPLRATLGQPLGEVPPAQAPPEPDLPDREVLPINLPTALQLAGVRPLDVALASERIQAAAAQLQGARTLWLPHVYLGADYARQDGRIQDIAGQILTTSRSSLMVGAGPSAVFAVSDAIYAPLAARQVVRARQAEQQAAVYDTTLAVAEAYFNVQQARGELAGAIDTLTRALELVRRTDELARKLVPPVEASRARAELARRRQAVQFARERWETASAELARLLRLDPAALLEPIESPDLRVDLLDPSAPVDELISVGLTNRPELAARQALVQATLARLRQEKIRPLVPSVLLRGNATNPAGTLSGGLFGGGINDDMSNFGARHTFDVQLLWELRNLGLGNRAAVRERESENRQALLELFRQQDRIAAEVVQAQSQARRAAVRVGDAEEGLREAAETAAKNIEGSTQTRRAGDLIVMVFRPQEVVAALQALAQAYNDFYAAVADANRAQFRLYRALGQPASNLAACGLAASPQR
ncbi:MAG: TolC family protein [Gemmataceae bacterium]|nr:TolC family protein [Gemmataceae bacterium]